MLLKSVDVQYSVTLTHDRANSMNASVLDLLCILKFPPSIPFGSPGTISESLVNPKVEPRDRLGFTCVGAFDEDDITCKNARPRTSARTKLRISWWKLISTCHFIIITYSQNGGGSSFFHPCANTSGRVPICSKCFGGVTHGQVSG